MRWLEREEHARLESERLLQAYDEFVAVLTHDLQNPLTAIQGRVQLLHRRMQQRAGLVNAEQVLATLDSIERSAKSMASLIQELLDIARACTLARDSRCGRRSLTWCS